MRKLGHKNYELTNHLGNVNAVITDARIGTDEFEWDGTGWVAGADGIVDYYRPTVESAYDYYPFGWTLPGRKKDLGYRFGFNGMEGDNEMKGSGNSYTTEYRQYDSRLGRWLSIDPKMAKYPAWSPYIFALDNPIWFNDPKGNEPPKFTREQLIAASIDPSLKTIQKLFGQLGPGWGLYVRETGHSVTSTSDLAIVINNSQDIAMGLKDLAWELTNAKNAALVNDLQNKARKGEISKDAYIKGIAKIEAETELNAMKTIVEQGLSLEGLFSSDNISSFEYYVDGKISEDDLLGMFANRQFTNGKIDAGDGKGLRPAKDVYGEQYDRLKPQWNDGSKLKSPSILPYVREHNNLFNVQDEIECNDGCIEN